MGNKGGYILGTSLAKDKTQIISDLLLFMDFVWVAIRVGEAPNFLSCHRLVNVGWDGWPHRCQEGAANMDRKVSKGKGCIKVPFCMALPIGNWYMSSFGTSMAVSTGAYFNSGVNKLKRSGRLKRDTRLGSDVWFKSTRRMAGMQPPVILQYPQNRFMGLLFLCFVCNQLHFRLYEFYWLFTLWSLWSLWMCDMHEAEIVFFDCHVAPQPGWHESFLRTGTGRAVWKSKVFSLVPFIFIEYRYLFVDIHLIFIDILVSKGWHWLIGRTFCWDSIQLRLIGENYRRIVTPVITDLDVGTADSAVQTKHVFWCHWSLGCSMKVFWCILDIFLMCYGPSWQDVAAAWHWWAGTSALFILVHTDCIHLSMPVVIGVSQKNRWDEKDAASKNPKQIGVTVVLTACGKEVDRDRFLSHKKMEFLKATILNFPWGKMLSYLGCGLQVVWIRRSVVSSRAAKNLLCLSYFGIRSTLRRTKKCFFCAPCAKLIHLRSSLGTRIIQRMPVCTCHVSEVIDHYVPRLLARV